MKRLMIIMILLMATNSHAIFLGERAVNDTVKFPIFAYNDTNRAVTPDSCHVKVYYNGDAANTATYSATGGAGASSAWIDSSNEFGGTEYYFFDLVGDIDSNKANGLYTGTVNAWTQGKKTANPFSFLKVGGTAAGDDNWNDGYWGDYIPGVDIVQISGDAGAADTLENQVNDAAQTLQEYLVSIVSYTDGDASDGIEVQVDNIYQEVLNINAWNPITDNDSLIIDQSTLEDIAINLDNATGTLSDAQVDNITVTAGTVSDKTGYALSAAGNKSVSDSVLNDSLSYQGAGADASPSAWDATDSAKFYGLVWSASVDTPKIVAPVMTDGDSILSRSDTALFVGSDSLKTLMALYADSANVVSVANDAINLVTDVTGALPDSNIATIGVNLESVTDNAIRSADFNIDWYDSLKFTIWAETLDGIYENTSAEHRILTILGYLDETIPLPNGWLDSSEVADDFWTAVTNSSGSDTTAIKAMLAGQKIDSFMVDTLSLIRQRLGGFGVNDRSSVDSTLHVYLERLSNRVGGFGENDRASSQDSSLRTYVMQIDEGKAEQSTADSILDIVAAGTGPYLCSLYVSNGDGALNTGKLRMVQGATAWVADVNSSGWAIFGLTSGTWYGTCYVPGSTQDTIPQTFSISADLTDSVSMTKDDADSNTVVAYLYTYDFNGDTVDNAQLTVTVNGVAPFRDADSNLVMIPQKMVAYSDTLGLAQITIKRSSGVTDFDGNEITYNFNFTDKDYFSAIFTDRTAPDSALWQIK